MTKAERFAEEEAAAKRKLTESYRVLAQARARIRTEAKKATDKRRYQVGALADEAGLLTWTNAELAAAFTALAQHRAVSTEVGIPDAPLSDCGVFHGVSENGVAETGSRVSAAH